ncbi:hypothetical protein AVV36_gp290 [Pectobacterium bacteriophage PM2]|uniref:Uncharacterized protein n=1 Tax=Pectobacterium bacteriophage PM2 TaxID=1429794 RepID=A0A0A0Q2F8_9CAUD|nr:hypothetical protein AVV36_gp290 [Pectobacterium bacteriophage PM2]AHY25120.1 hypothetical protein PM2_158 [Pectobacterium bacteriophage PM2]
MIYVRVSYPDNGYQADRLKAQELLKVHGEGYIRVKKIKIGRSSTDVELVSDQWSYNSVNFSFYQDVNGRMTEIDIFNTEHKDIEYTYVYLKN